MLQPHVQETIIPALSAAPLVAVVHEVFGTGPLVLAVALVGAWFGLAALPAGEACKSLAETLTRFLSKLVLIAGATISAGFLVSIFLSRFAELQYPISFFGAMMLVYHHKKLFKLSGKIIEKKAGEI